MASTMAKINIKNIDYFKFKKIVMDGNRDDYSSCSKEVKALCDAVQTLSFRDEEFDETADRARFDEIIAYYRQILASKRIESLDMRLKSGWWGGGSGDKGGGGVYSAGKIKPAALIDTLASKTRDWVERHGNPTMVQSPNHSPQSPAKGGTGVIPMEKVEEKLEGPGLFVFKHREHQCFQYVGRAENVFTRCTELLKAAYEPPSVTVSEPITALFVISVAADWDFYFVPTSANDNDLFLHIFENDLLIKHDSIWPHGLNFSLRISTLIEVSEFRKSCIRHCWPPEKTTATTGAARPPMDLGQLRTLVTSTGETSGDGGRTPDGRNGTTIASQKTSGTDTAASGKSKSTPAATRVPPKNDTSPSAAPSVPTVTTSLSTKSSTASQKQPTSSTADRKPAAAIAAANTAKIKRAKSPSNVEFTSISKSPSKGGADDSPLSNSEKKSTNGTGEKCEEEGDKGEEEEDLKPTGTLKRSNTFTFSDSEEVGSADGGKT